MPSYCCFWCPKKDFAEHALSDRCSTCRKTFGSPLDSPPTTIDRFSIVRPLARGFYSVAYLAVQSALGREVVLKVVPKAIYSFFGKSWLSECKEHSDVAKNNPFIANIIDQFDAEVGFGDGSLPSHVAVLEYIDGPTLEEVLSDPASHELNARKAAQIASDLFEILSALVDRERFHNDLHSRNIVVRKLDDRDRRQDAFDPMVRAVAVDLGSMLDRSQSGDERLGDQHHVARQLAQLASSVRQRTGIRADSDFRISEALRGLAEHLVPQTGAQRIMTAEEAKEALRRAIQAVDEPWNQPLVLRRFGDAYNAQVLEPWHVPQLWFDPDGQWFKKIASRGPQVITGMRGCGKTILLKALHFHARARQIPNATRDVSLEALRNDGFVGLYVSCQKLLNPQDVGQSDEIRAPFERLYTAFLRDALQVLRHLRSMDATAAVAPIDDLLASALDVVEFPNPLNRPSALSFEQDLATLQLDLADGSAVCRLKVAPPEAFGHLAAIIKRSSPLFSDQYVLFLLDDVSTRYLPPATVRAVISQLLFQHSICAFRITTETQALHRVLLSPGGKVPADPVRDYEEFDLGREVYRLLQDRTLRQRFNLVLEVLKRRALHFTDAVYKLDPSDVLGDVPLEQVAREIAGSSGTSPQRKRVYRGLRALQAVCVGDLGDVVKLYEKILLKANPDELPVRAEKQCECFLEHSASLLHFLNRRDQRKKAIALAFAQASAELLQRSVRPKTTNGSETGSQSASVRLRQYTKLYARVEPGEGGAEVAEALLDLLDAGVFVYDGGVPRTKTRDDDPVLEFKLSYRKLFGVASFIGLADRDRFELSGERLRQFVSSPDNAMQILLESETQSEEDEPIEEEWEPDERSKQKVSEHRATQLVLGTTTPNGIPSDVTVLEQVRHVKPAWLADLAFAPFLGLSTSQHSLTEWQGTHIDTLVLALGFEERTLVSARRLLNALQPRRVVVARYSGDDQGREIEKLIKETGLPTQEVRSVEELSELTDTLGDDILVDSTGLTKAFLFAAVFGAFRRTNQLKVAHTLAETHYPRNSDLEAIGIRPDTDVSGDLFAKLDQVLVGEQGPYKTVQVSSEPALPERPRGLIASASPKNDRLLHLLDERNYEAIRILVPPPSTARRRVTRAAAELAATIADVNTKFIEVPTNDLVAAVAETETVFRDLYFGLGMNVELALTGTKMYAAAGAAVAAAARISQVWYVKPTAFDPQRYTAGVSDTHCFILRRSVPQSPPDEIAMG